MAQGPVYDNVLRLLATVDLEALCGWLGVRGLQAPQRLSEALPVTQQHADLVVRVAPGRLVHVEFTVAPEPWFAERMVEYRARIMRRELGDVLTQHVLVLARGRVPSMVRNGDDFAMRLHVVHLRDHDPNELLSEAALAPLAVLGRTPGGRAGAAAVLRSAFQVLAAVPDPTRRKSLVDITTVLAAIRLDADTIEKAREESQMPIDLAQTIGGRSLIARGEARGEARGAAAARRRMLVALLEQRFGADPRIAAIAERLAALGDDRAADAVRLATTETLDDLGYATDV